MKSGAPPVAVEIVGVPDANDSSRVIPQGSNLDVNSEKVKVNLIYAFNGTGKTRMSRMFTDKFEDKVLCFNSMFQDEFSWKGNHSDLIKWKGVFRR